MENIRQESTESALGYYHRKYTVVADRRLSYSGRQQARAILNGVSTELEPFVKLIKMCTFEEITTPEMARDLLIRAETAAREQKATLASSSSPSLSASHPSSSPSSITKKTIASVPSDSVAAMTFSVSDPQQAQQYGAPKPSSNNSSGDSSNSTSSRPNNYNNRGNQPFKRPFNNNRNTRTESTTLIKGGINELERRLEEDPCYACGVAGHIAKNCRNLARLASKAKAIQDPDVLKYRRSFGRFNDSPQSSSDSNKEQPGNSVSSSPLNGK
jgi:hypothetical protein